MKTWWDGLRAQFESRQTTKTMPWLQDFQTKSFEHYEQLGLPNAKQDDWRATPVRQLFSDTFLTEQAVDEMIPCSVPENTFYIGIKGCTTKLSAHELPTGVTVLPILDAIAKFPELFKKYLGQIGLTSHGLSALNEALFNSGVFIHIAKDTDLQQPIFIHHQLVDGCIDHCRHLVVLEENASATILEYFDGAQHQASMLNHTSEMVLQDGAVAHHLKIQQLGTLAKLQSQAFVRQQQSSQLHSFMLQLGGDISSCDMDVDLCGAQAKADLTGLFLPSGKQFHQQRIHIHHQVPNCQSDQNFRGILDNEARAVFIGRVTVAKGADKTEAHQSNKNLLLAKTAHMVTAPQLQIFADDVVCSHGATVGQLDEDAMFYLRSRGFGEQQAKDMLVNAFIRTYFDSIANPTLRDWCLNKIERE